MEPPPAAADQQPAPLRPPLPRMPIQSKRPRSTIRGPAPRRRRAQNGNACQRCYDAKTKCCGQFPCERCFKLCLPCRPRPRINGAAPDPNSALAIFLNEHRARVQQQRTAARRAEKRALAEMEGLPPPESDDGDEVVLQLDAEGMIVNGPPITHEEVVETSPAEARALLALVLTRVDRPKLADGYLKAVVAARDAGRIHIPSAVATIRAWRRTSRLVGGDASLGLAGDMTRALGLSPADLSLGEMGGGVPGQLLVNGIMGMDGEEPGMTPALRRTRAAVAAQQAAHAAACIKTSAFYRNLAGSGPVPNCRGANPHCGAGVLLLCRTEAGGAGFSPVGAGGADGGFHMVANKAFAHYLPEPAALLMDAYVSRTLPTLLLAGFMEQHDRCSWYRALVDAFFSAPPPLPPLGPDGRPVPPPPQPPYESSFIKLFDHCGDMRLVMVRFSRLSTTAAGLGLVPPRHPGHDVRASCLVVRVEAMPSSRHLTDRPDTSCPRKTKHFRRGYANFASGGLSAGGDKALEWGQVEAEDGEDNEAAAAEGLASQEKGGDGGLFDFRLAPVGFAALAAGRGWVKGELERRKREGGGKAVVGGGVTGAGDTKGGEEEGGKGKGKAGPGADTGAKEEARVPVPPSPQQREEDGPKGGKGGGEKSPATAAAAMMAMSAAQKEEERQAQAQEESEDPSTAAEATPTEEEEEEEGQQQQQQQKEGEDEKEQEQQPPPSKLEAAAALWASASSAASGATSVASASPSAAVVPNSPAATATIDIFAKGVGSEYMREILATAKRSGSAAAIELGAGGAVGVVDQQNPAAAAWSVVESVRQQAIQQAVLAARAAARVAARAAAQSGGGGGGGKGVRTNVIKHFQQPDLQPHPVAQAAGAKQKKPPKKKPQQQGEGTPARSLRLGSFSPPSSSDLPASLAGAHHQHQHQQPPSPAVLAALRALGAAHLPPPHHHPHAGGLLHHAAPTTALPADLRQPSERPGLPGLPPIPRLSYPPTGAQQLLVAAAAGMRHHHSGTSSSSSALAFDAATATDASPSKRPRLEGAAVVAAAAAPPAAAASAPAGPRFQYKPTGSAQGAQQQDRGTSPDPREREGAAMALLSLSYWQ